MALLALIACDDGGPSRTIVPTEMPFAEMFRLVRVVTPEQSPESPIALISGARWDGDRIAIADASEGNAKLFDSDGFVSDFAALPDGRLIFAGEG